MHKKNDLLNGNVLFSLVRFTIPILFALLLQILYGAVDLLIVGNFGTVADVSGVSVGSQFLSLLTNICAGLAMGTTVHIGHKIGENRRGDVAGIIFNSAVMFFALAIVLLVCLLLFNSELVSALNTPAEALETTSDYLFYCTLGIPMIFAYNIIGSILRGLGDSKTPLVAVGIACVANIVLDLILVAVFDMGAAGAAIATVVAQSISVVCALAIIKLNGTLGIQSDTGAFTVKLSTLKRIISLGLPIALQSGLVSLSFLFVMVIVNTFGVVYSAAVGLTEKLTGMIMLVPIAFMQALSVFVAQNYGANNMARARKGLKFAMLLSVVFGAIMAYLSFFHGELLALLFSRDEAVVAASANYLEAYAIDTLLVSVLFCVSGYFNGCGRTVFVMVQAVAGAMLIRVPLTYLLSNIESTSLFIIGLATPSATAMQLLLFLAYAVILHVKKHDKAVL